MKAALKINLNEIDRERPEVKSLIYERIENVSKLIEIVSDPEIDVEKEPVKGKLMLNDLFDLENENVLI